MPSRNKNQVKPVSGSEKYLLHIDYYLDRGNWVFTKDYLTKRGYCCQSGCRHCPYGFIKTEHDRGKRNL